MWSGTTRVRMFEAIEEAGFLARGMDKVHFVSKAESAACYYLRASGTSTPFEPGDVVLVCDAGGGTTDFATFATQSDLRSHQLQSAAIRCGAADVDYRLYKMMCRCLGVTTDELSDELRGPNDRLMKTIRKVKGNFSHEPLKKILLTGGLNAASAGPGPSATHDSAANDLPPQLVSP
ncbi:hypothetical protein N8T08_008850 [Aspergillus melleus]|uniref:Uncharacterized protein n=1 Tax=Aspergillus melleus TaxID=138277 RepID=A0ACC3AW33_9EURO|nr:hypothetical protein N8T08_008850 [Aspergillus melleus]